jgi:uncharacterized membrane protein YgcG
MINKFIKPFVPIMASLCFLLLISCTVFSKAESAAETAEPNTAAETMSSPSTESIRENGEYPNPVGWVNDFAEIFKQEDIDKMNELLTDLEKETTAEVAVVTVSSLNGKSIETYANELFNTWGIGKKDVNNGVLFLVAPNESQCRIEVGYGMENVITDVIASHIIDEVAIPSFKEGEYSLGSYEVVKELSEEILAAYK